MAQIKNTGTLKEIQEAGNLQTGFDQIPTEASKAVVYTMEVNPKMLRISNIAQSGAATNATSGTIYTTPTGKDFYLVAVSLSVIKDVTSTSTFTSIGFTVNGVVNSVCNIAGITLTPQANTMSMSFSNPIKIDRGTAITINNFTNVANISARGSIVGYTVEAQGA